MNKKASLNIRFTTEQRRKINRAADLETRRTRQNVEPSTLVRELVMPKIEEILASADQPAAA